MALDPIALTLKSVAGHRDAMALFVAIISGPVNIGTAHPELSKRCQHRGEIGLLFARVAQR